MNNDNILVHFNSFGATFSAVQPPPPPPQKTIIIAKFDYISECIHGIGLKLFHTNPMCD